MSETPSQSEPKTASPIDGFFVAMLLGVVLAWLYPEGGREGGWMHAKLLGRVGIALVFFLNGALLPFVELKRGFRAWHTHLLVQGSTFVVFPLLGIGILALAGDHLESSLKTGVFFLCALPSTVTSAVALTSAANGSVPLALFNSSLSSLLGVVLTPVWLSVVLGTSSQTGDLGGTMTSLVSLLLLPLLVGQVSRHWIGEWLGRHKSAAKLVDRLVILLLVHSSFCDSFDQGVWAAHGWLTLGIVVPGAVLLFVLMFRLSNAGCRVLGLGEAQRRAAVLCASQKSLAVGVPMAQVFFGTSPALGIILLPILIYHPLQIGVSGWIVSRWLRTSERTLSH